MTVVCSKNFLSKEAYKICIPAVLYFLIRFSDIIKLYPEIHLLIHVVVLSKKGETQIMGKDQLNPFQLNCAGELGRK